MSELLLIWPGSLVISWTVAGICPIWTSGNLLTRNVEMEPSEGHLDTVLMPWDEEVVSIILCVGQEPLVSCCETCVFYFFQDLLLFI